MPSNPFRRLGTFRSPSSSSGFGGITIAAAEPSSTYTRPEISSPTQISSPIQAGPSTSLSLPPESDYRTSLIMPHLTRRFTLLRAPDGSMVTPDAMRAHLRAQRARARATGVPGNQNFLTEEEENEIIDQLRRQTYLEMQEDDEQQNLAQETYSPEQGFGGTDGFGGWGSTDGASSSHRTSQMDETSTQHQHSNSNQDPSVGGFFSGRSSARDHAYINEVEKNRAAREKEERIPKTDLEQVDEEADAADSEEAMPGDFLVATKRASKQSSDDAAKQHSTSKGSNGGLAPPGHAHLRQSQLLTTLSPEAFKRVSTALEEVFGMVAGRIDENGAERLGNGSESSGRERGLEEGHEDYEEEEVIGDEDSAHSLNRPSMESDAHSFTSAQSEVRSMAPQQNYMRGEPDGASPLFGGVVMATADSTSTIRAVAPQEWTRTDETTSQDDSMDSLQQPYRGVHSTGPSSSHSGDYDAGFTASSPRSRLGQFSIDAANGRMKRGPASPNAMTYSLDNARFAKSSGHSLGGSSSPVSSPLHAGFDHASSKSTASSSSAAATAAGIAAAAYVAQQQEKKLQQDRALQDGQSSSNSSQPPVTSQIVRGGVGAASHDSNFSSPGRPAVIRSPSAAANSVLSANAIAARSPHYFPTSTGSMQKYADGFRPANTTATSSGSHTGHISSPQLPPSSPGLNTLAGRPQLSMAPTPGVSVSPSAELHPSADEDNTRVSEDQSKASRLYSGAYSSQRDSVDGDHGEMDDEGSGDVDEDDVWARVARNTAASDVSSVDSREDLLQPQTAPDAHEPEISIDKLQAIQNSLVRSASSKQKAVDPADNQPAAREAHSSVDSEMPSASPAPPLPTHSMAFPVKSNVNHRSTGSTSSDASSSAAAHAKLEKARERARMLAEKQQAQLQSPAPPPPSKYTSVISAISLPSDEDQSQMQQQDNQVGTGAAAANAKPSPNAIPTEASPSAPATLRSVGNGAVRSPRSARSQVMYDVTTSHRPTSPPPRGHKTSLSNLPSLQDLSLSASAAAFALGADPRHSSLSSMAETSAQAHDALVRESTGEPTPAMQQRLPQPIPEENADRPLSVVEYEEIKVEDGFGGFTTERRPIVRSQSHDVLSSMGQMQQQQSATSPGLASPMTPYSTYSDPTGRGNDANGGNDSNPWAKMGNPQDATYHDNMLDDVAAQAQAATYALKGGQPSRPRVTNRTKSLSRGSRKKLSRNISQPQLLSTTQRLEHAQEVPKIDRTLSRKDNKRQEDSPMKPQQPSGNGAGPTRVGTMAGYSALKANSTLFSPSSSSPRAARSAAGSPTDYRSESKAPSRMGVGHVRRSSSFGHQGRLDNEWSARSATPPASAPIQTQNYIDVTPQSDRSPGSLSRFMSRLRARGPSDGSPLVSSSPAAMKSSPALSAYGTPSTSASAVSPVFVTPGEEVGAMPSPSRNLGPRRLPVPEAGATSLAGLFGSGSLPPPRTSSARFLSSNVPQAGAASRPIVGALGSPATIQDGWGQSNPAPGPATMLPRETSEYSRDSIPLGDTTETGLSSEPVARQTSQSRSARDTIVRRTIIVSTIEGDERRKSGAPVRKTSVRKPVPTDGVAKTTSSIRDSTTSSVGRKSLQDRPPTPPGPEGISGAHRRKLSQDVIAGQPMPPVARNLYEAPASNSLAPPPPGQGLSNRMSSATATSDYGASLYDMYIDDGSDMTHQRQSRLVPPLPSSRQSLAGETTNGARHIEVTERADGSVVWQVIAGLADRSSSYSASMLGGGHSRADSDDSQASSPHFDEHFSSQLSRQLSTTAANEDGRSLFARTKGKPRESLSYDGKNGIPPIPSLGNTLQPATHPLEFDMATPGGGAATRIVYTSDAELANMLESLAGPDKTSAKFEFQRVNNVDGSVRPVSVWTNEDKRGSDVDKRVSKDGQATSRSGSSIIDSKDRIRIEAEIYTLLQRDGHPKEVAATVAKQHADRVSQHTQDARTSLAHEAPGTQDHV